MSKKDKLEKFIESNHHEFDSFEPPKSLWDKIDNELNTIEKTEVTSPSNTKVISLWQTVKKVAAVLLIATTSIVIYELLKTDRHDASAPALAEKKSPTEKIESLPKEVLEIEAYYQQQLKTKLTELKSHTNVFPEVEQDLNVDFEMLDEAYQELKNDLKDQMANEEVLDAMIRNHRLKLSILEDLLFEIQEKDTPDDTKIHL